MYAAMLINSKGIAYGTQDVFTTYVPVKTINLSKSKATVMNGKTLQLNVRSHFSKEIHKQIFKMVLL